MTLNPGTVSRIEIWGCLDLGQVRDEGWNTWRVIRDRGSELPVMWLLYPSTWSSWTGEDLGIKAGAWSLVQMRGSCCLGLCSSLGEVAGPGCAGWGDICSHGVGIKQPGLRFLSRPSGQGPGPDLGPGTTPWHQGILAHTGCAPGNAFCEHCHHLQPCPLAAVPLLLP